MKHIISSLLLSAVIITGAYAMRPAQASRQALEQDLKTQKELLNNAGPMMKVQIQKRIEFLEGQLGSRQLAQDLINAGANDKTNTGTKALLQQELQTQKDLVDKVGPAMKQQIEKRIASLEEQLGLRAAQKRTPKSIKEEELKTQRELVGQVGPAMKSFVEQRIKTLEAELANL